MFYFEQLVNLTNEFKEQLDNLDQEFVELLQQYGIKSYRMSAGTFVVSRSNYEKLTQLPFKSNNSDMYGNMSEIKIIASDYLE